MKRIRFITVLLFCLLLFLFSQTPIFLLDAGFLFYYSAGSLHSLEQGAQLLLNLLSLYLFWASLAGLLTGLITGILIWTLRSSLRIRRLLTPLSEKVRNWAGLGLIATLPYLVFFSLKISDGGWVRRSGIRPHLVTGLILGGGLAAWLLTGRILKAVLIPSLEGGRTLGAQSILLLSGFLLFLVNAFVLPSYYPIFHFTLALLSFAIFILSAFPSFFKRLDYLFRSRGQFQPLMATGVILTISGYSLFLNHRFFERNDLRYLIDMNGIVSPFMMEGLNPLLLREGGNFTLNIPEGDVKKGGGDRWDRSGPEIDPTSTTPFAQEGRKNILLITVDALRPMSMSLYGYERKTTPAIDRFAEGAMVFTRAYTPSPHSSYSISSLFTSRYFITYRRLKGKDAAPPTLPEILDDHGYHTEAIFTDSIFFTKSEDFSLFKDNSFGFSSVTSDNLCYDAKYLTPRAIDRMRDLWGRDFFLWVHYFDPHEPYTRLPGFSFGNSPLDRYEGEILLVDSEIGKIIDFLAGNNLLMDTYVVLTSDHGEGFGEHRSFHHGASLYEEEIRVPLVIGGGGIRGGGSSLVVNLVDIAPTLLGLAGIPSSADFDGRDLSPFLMGMGGEPAGAFAFSENLSGKKAFIKGEEKVIFSSHEGIWEYYHLGIDPEEKRSLAYLMKEPFGRLKGEFNDFLRMTASRYTTPPAGEKGEVSMNLNLALLGNSGARKRLLKSLGSMDEETLKGVAPRVVDIPGIKREEALSYILPLIERGEGCPPSLAIVALRTGIDHPLVMEIIKDSLSSPACRISHLSAIELGKRGDTEALPVLLKGIKEENGKLREEMARSLCYIDSGEALAELVELVRSGPSEVRRAVAENLGSNGKEDHIPPLIIALSDSYHLVRLGAVKSLAKIGSEEALDNIRRRLPIEEDEEVRGTILKVLGSSKGAGSTLSP